AGRDDVGFFAVLILEQSQTRRATRVVFDGLNRSFDAVLAAHEIDQADFLFVAATDASGRGPAISVPATSALADLDQALLGPVLRNIAKVRIRDVACGR